MPLPPTNCRLVLVDDHPLIIEYLRMLCRDTPGITVVGEAATGGLAVDLVCQLRPDMVVLDLSLPGLDGFEVMQLICRVPPAPKFLVVSAYCNERIVLELQHAAASGFVSKAEPPAVLRRAIASVAGGFTYFSPLFSTIKAELRRTISAYNRLTPQEIRVLLRVGNLISDAEIARDLQVDERTVEKHRLNATRKLCVQDRIGLQRFAREHGYRTTFS